MQNGNQDICNLVNDMIETWLETNYPSAFIHLYAHLAAIISPLLEIGKNINDIIHCKLLMVRLIQGFQQFSFHSCLLL